MADITATLFRFRQFVFEYLPWFLAVWMALAITSGLMAVRPKKVAAPKTPDGILGKQGFLRWIGQYLWLQSWSFGGKKSAPAVLGGLLVFSLAASVPALVVTSLIDMKTVGLRLVLAAVYALILHWFTDRIISPKRGQIHGQPSEAPAPPLSSVMTADSSMSSHTGWRGLVTVFWKRVTGQIEGAILPLVIGFSLASILTVYPPTYALQPWLGAGSGLGPYLAALVAISLPLTGGADVPLASALLVKGASLGTALSVMLAAPVSAFSVGRYRHQSVKGKDVALYLVVAWLVAGSLGVVVDLIQRLLGGG